MRLALVLPMMLLVGGCATGEKGQAPAGIRDVDEAVDRVIERLRSLGEREVQTNRVGDFVMRELAKLDKIAYIRFASVYRSFESPDDFREAVQEVKAGRKRRK